MLSRKEAPEQIGFVIAGENLQLLEHFSEHPRGREVMQILPTIRVWKDRKEGNLLVSDLAGKKNISVNVNNWTIAEVKWPELVFPEASFGSLVIVAPPNYLMESGEDLIETLRVNRLAFVPASVGIILEQMGDDKRVGWRRNLFNAAGLVKGEVKIEERDGLLVWTSRFPKERERFEINITSKDYPKLYHWARSEWAKMIISYKKRGLKIIDHSKLLDRLRHSFYVPGDMELLKLGFGVRLKAVCGCEWEVDLRGNWERYRECGNPDCDGVPKPL